MSAAWEVITSPTDAEMSAVHGVYLVADNLPLDDAQLIAAAPYLLAALQSLLTLHIAHHNAIEHAHARKVIARATGAA